MASVNHPLLRLWDQPLTALGLALWCLLSVISRGAENSPPVAEKLTPKDAYAMVDCGAFAHTKLPGYKAVSYQAADRNIIATTEFARQTAEGRRLARIERRNGDDLTIHLQNAAGKWLIRNGYAARITGVTQVWQTIPLRPPDLSRGDALFETVKASDYHGLPVLKLTAETGPMSGGARSRQKSDVSSRLTVGRHEFFFDPSLGLLLAWRAVTASGEVVKEVGYQEFTAGEQPASLFELPADVTVVEPKDREEWTRYFGPNTAGDAPR